MTRLDDWRATALLACAVVLAACGNDAAARSAPDVRVRAERLLDHPILSPTSHPELGTNIQGPSLIRVPDWVPSPLGRYYLYFADHKGDSIRLAYADALTGPWTVYGPGAIAIADSYFLVEAPESPPWDLLRLRILATLSGFRLPHDLEKELTAPHIASPDAHVDDAKRRIVLYFHGLEGFAEQVTRVATSSDGIHFDVQPQTLGKTYLRTLPHDGATVGLAMPGQLYRSEDGITAFEEGPRLFGPDMRHAALLEHDGQLLVFWTRVGDAPERILLSTIDLALPFESWTESGEVEVLRPERPWEGANAPLEPSIRSLAYGPVNQLRDPAIFVEDGRTYLLYAVAGESGIGIAELHFDDAAD
jgi:hypothetical protein